MSTRMTSARRFDEEVVNEGVPPKGRQDPQNVKVTQGEQVPIANKGNEIPVVPPDMTNYEIKSALFTVTRAMMDQANRDVGPRMKAHRVP